jgi:hypothetical protein
MRHWRERDVLISSRLGFRRAMAAFVFGHYWIWDVLVPTLRRYRGFLESQAG